MSPGRRSYLFPAGAACERKTRGNGKNEEIEWGRKTHVAILLLLLYKKEKKRRQAENPDVDAGCSRRDRERDGDGEHGHGYGLSAACTSRHRRPTVQWTTRNENIRLWERPITMQQDEWMQEARSSIVSYSLRVIAQKACATLELRASKPSNHPPASLSCRLSSSSSSPPSPLPRARAGAGIDSGGGSILVEGGCGMGRCGDGAAAVLGAWHSGQEAGGPIGRSIQGKTKEVRREDNRDKRQSTTIPAN
ncbi:hypothetical protein B0H13DRAFT_1890729 [Mycena leptocephala]|nr:hypothetical protein B0H13DRAFT_1890729 [Mycena leptocephala]